LPGLAGKKGPLGAAAPATRSATMAAGAPPAVRGSRGRSAAWWSGSGRHRRSSGREGWGRGRRPAAAFPATAGGDAGALESGPSAAAHAPRSRRHRPTRLHLAPVALLLRLAQGRGTAARHLGSPAAGTAEERGRERAAPTCRRRSSRRAPGDGGRRRWGIWEWREKDGEGKGRKGV
jgi:hypothetical protein